MESRAKYLVRDKNIYGYGGLAMLILRRGGSIHQFLSPWWLTC